MFLKIVLLIQMLLCAAPAPNTAEENQRKIKEFQDFALSLKDNILLYKNDVQIGINGISNDTVTWSPNNEIHLDAVKNLSASMGKSLGAVVPLLDANGKTDYHDGINSLVKELEDLNGIISAKVQSSAQDSLKQALDLKSKEVVEATSLIKKLLIQPAAPPKQDPKDPGFLARYIGWILLAVLVIIIGLGAAYIYHSKVLNK